MTKLLEKQEFRRLKHRHIPYSMNNKGRTSKYMPHQGKQECARRIKNGRNVQSS